MTLFETSKKLTISLSLIATLALGTLYASEVKVNNTTAELTPVTVKNFQRAESDHYFSTTVKLSGIGKFYHYRTPTAIDKQNVVRMNRDTLYSGGVFDLDAGSVTLTLPDAGERFMSMQVVSEDHYTPIVGYGPGTYTLSKENIGTRYVMVIMRTLLDATDPEDVKIANAMQDQIKIQQSSPGEFTIPNWDAKQRDKVRKLLGELQSMSGVTTERRMGKKEEVDPIFHLLATATGWGLNPPEAAVYKTVYPKGNDGKTAYTLTLKDVPVDGFWSITMYNSEGYMFENDQKAYALNNYTTKPNADGSITIQFGGDPKNALNYLAITEGWNFSFRLYRPRQEVIDGTWTLPELQPMKTANQN